MVATRRRRLRRYQEGGSVYVDPWEPEPLRPGEYTATLQRAFTPDVDPFEPEPVRPGEYSESLGLEPSFRSEPVVQQSPYYRDESGNLRDRRYGDIYQQPGEDFWRSSEHGLISVGGDWFAPEEAEGREALQSFAGHTFGTLNAFQQALEGFRQQQPEEELVFEGPTGPRAPQNLRERFTAQGHIGQGRLDFSPLAIPGAAEAARRFGEAARLAAQGVSASRAGRGGGTLPQVAEFAAEAAVPRTFPELGLELIPGIGFAPDIARGGRAAIRAGRGAATAATRPAVRPVPNVVRVAAREGAIVPSTTEGLAASRGAFQVADPAGVRILGPDEFAGPGETILFHGTAGDLAGPIRPGTFLTPDAADAQRYASASAALARRPAGVLRRFATEESGFVRGGRSSIYHEGDVDDLIDALPSRITGRSARNKEWWFASDPSLALGQGTRRGILLEFDAKKVSTTSVSNKPAAAFTGPELYLRGTPPEDALRSVTIQPSATMTRPERSRLIDSLRRAGFERVINPDGSVTFSRSGPLRRLATEERAAVGGTDDFASQLEASLAAPDAVRSRAARVRSGLSPETRRVEDLRAEARSLGISDQGTPGRLASRLERAKAAGGAPPATPPPSTAGAGQLPPPSPSRVETSHDFDLVDEITALIGAPRTVKASFDLSAPGRQGLGLALRHPVEWAQSWVPMIRAWRSDEGMRAVNSKIANIMQKWADEPWAAEVPDMLHFYETGPTAEGLKRVPGFEPAGKGFVSKAIRKIPFMENSERAYATFLNYQKAKTFDNMASAYKRAGVADSKTYRDLGQIIDHATGFGAAPLKGRVEGQALFSQRYFTSRLQFLTDPIVEGLMKGDLRTARAATENLVAFLGGMAGIIQLGHETGAWEATLNPLSSEFGKIRVGPLRLDFGAGFLPLIRTATRVATGEAKAATGDIYEVERHKEALKFLRNKLAPLPAEVVDRFVGENVIGEKPGKLLSLDTVANLFMPLIADAVLEAFKETGDPKTIALAGLSELVGGAASTYGGGQVMQVQLAAERFGKEYDSLYAEQQAQVNRQVLDSGMELPWRDRNSPWWQARDDAFARWQADVDPELLADPFTQKALSIERSADLEQELVTWTRQTYGVSREQAEKAVDKFLKETRLFDYMQAYRKDVLANDPGLLDAWDEAFEVGEIDYPPPKWAREFIEEVGR